MDDYSHIFLENKIIFPVRIAVNRCIDQLRFQKRRRSIDLEPTNSEGEADGTPIWLSDNVYFLH